MGGKEKNDTSDFTKVKSHQEVNEKTDGQSGDKAPALRTSRDVEGGEHGQSGDQATSALTVEGEKPIAIDSTAFHVGNIAEVVFETLPSITLNVINMTMLTRDGVAAVEWTNILSLLCLDIYDFPPWLQIFLLVCHQGDEFQGPSNSWYAEHDQEQLTGSCKRHKGSSKRCKGHDLGFAMKRTATEK